MELIGYDSWDNRGPIINQETSVNYLTKRKLVRKNINQNAEESGDEIFDEQWEELKIGKLLRLSEIKDFDAIDLTTK